MTLYINTNINQYPFYEGDMVLYYPDWISGDVLPEGVYEVEYTYPPELDNKFVFESDPLFIDNKWVMQWSFRDLTEKEAAIVNKPSKWNPQDWNFDEESLTWIEDSKYLDV